MTGTIVRSLKARAVIAKPASEIRRARREALRGDRGWQERLERFNSGDVVIAELTVTAVIEGANDGSQTLPCGHETVWIDRQTARAAAEERLRQVARRDFKSVGEGLRDHSGVELGDRASAIAVDVSIEAALAQRLEPGTAGEPAP